MPARSGLGHVEIGFGYLYGQAALGRIDRLDQLLRVRAQGRRNGRLVVEQAQRHRPESRGPPRHALPSVRTRTSANSFGLLQQGGQRAVEHGAELVLFDVPQDRIEEGVGGVNGQIDRDEAGKAEVVVSLVDVKEVSGLGAGASIDIVLARRGLGFALRWWILRRQEEALLGQQFLVRGFQSGNAGQVPDAGELPVLSRRGRASIRSRLCA